IGSTPRHRADDRGTDSDANCEFDSDTNFICSGPSGATAQFGKGADSVTVGDGTSTFAPAITMSGTGVFTFVTSGGTDITFKVGANEMYKFLDGSANPGLVIDPTNKLIAGDITSGGDLTLSSTTHATKDDIFLGSAGNSVYDEANDRLGLGIATPQSLAHLLQTGDAADDSILANWGLIIGNVLNTTGLEVGIGFRVSSGQFDTVIPGAAITHERTGLNSRGSLHFKTSSDGASLTTRMTLDKDGNLGLGQTVPAAKLHIEEEGTAKANLDIMQIVNPVNAADMDGTRTSILWRLARVTDTLLDAGRIGFEAADDWTATASTQDADFVVECRSQGVMTEHIRFTPDAFGGVLNIFGRIDSRRADGVSNPFRIFAYNDDAGLPPVFSCRKARNTFASPAAVQNGDLIGGFDCRGYDGSSHQQRASLYAICDGTVIDASNTVPMSLNFRTGTTTSTTDRLTIDSSGDVTLDTANVRLNFGGTDVYIEDISGALAFGAINDQRMKLSTGILSLVAGANNHGSLRWDSNFVSIYQGSGNQAIRVSSTTVSMLGGVKIGSAHGAAATSADLELSSTVGAFLNARMTTTQRNALTAANGMQIYNSTTNAFNFYENGAWVTGSGLA
ncbi:hypothetical protein LCGC14_2204370, partial [marine sediment metagenome]